MFYVFLANGFEEIEALAPVDFLRRMGVEVLTVGISGKTVCGAHGIKVEADILLSDVELDEKLQGIMLPGGMPGADNLDKCTQVQNAIDYCTEKGKIISAICAAPFILGKKGLLKGKKATCFPGFENELSGAEILNDGVVTDGNIITARGAGVAWEFGAAIGAALDSKEKSDSVLKAIQWKK